MSARHPYSCGSIQCSTCYPEMATSHKLHRTSKYAECSHEWTVPNDGTTGRHVCMRPKGHDMNHVCCCHQSLAPDRAVA